MDMPPHATHATALCTIFAMSQKVPLSEVDDPIEEPVASVVEPEKKEPARCVLAFLVLVGVRARDSVTTAHALKDEAASLERGCDRGAVAVSLFSQKKAF